MKKVRLVSLLALAAASVGTLIGCNSNNDSGKAVKIGLICLHDSSSTYDANFINAMDEAVKNLGDKVIFEKNCLLTGVPEDNSCYDAAKDLVERGCKVIIADSFGHQTAMLNAAKDFPNVQFCHATGTNAKTAGVKNYHNAFASIYQGRFMAGYAAGLKLVDSKKAELDAGTALKVGYVGAYPYAEVKSGYTSWFLGVRNALRDYNYNDSLVTMDVEFTGEWYHPEKESNQADKLIKAGCVLISQHADSMGAPSTCEQAGIPNVTYNIETKGECPNTYLAYSRINWAPYYEAVVNAVYNGKDIEGEVNANWTGTAATGSVEYNVNWANVTSDATKLADYKAKFAAVEKDVKEKAAAKVFDCSTFKVNGANLTTYLADTDGDYKGESEAIAEKNGVKFFNESALASAPYFDIDIDGINPNIQ